jgi:hypothetical protein
VSQYLASQVAMLSITPSAILLYYDFPQVFVGNSVTDQNYCCMVVGETIDGPEYLCTPVSRNRTEALLSGGLELRVVFESPESNTFFLSSHNENKEDLISLCLQDYSVCPEILLPQSGLVFDEIDVVASKSLELNATVSYVSLSVPESAIETRINSDKLAQFLSLYQSVVRHLNRSLMKISGTKLESGKRGSELDVFGFSRGSFTVQLRSAEASDILGDNGALSNSLEGLGRFIKSIENTDDAVEFLKSVKGHTAGSIIRLLEFLDEHECPLKQQWATPAFGVSDTSKTSVEGVRNLVRICREKEDLSEVVVELTGIVIAANVNASSWKMRNEIDGVTYSGLIEENATFGVSGIIIDTQRYRFICIERHEVNVGTGQEKSNLFARSIETLD